MRHTTIFAWCLISFVGLVCSAFSGTLGMGSFAKAAHAANLRVPNHTASSIPRLPVSLSISEERALWYMQQTSKKRNEKYAVEPLGPLKEKQVLSRPPVPRNNPFTFPINNNDTVRIIQTGAQQTEAYNGQFGDILAERASYELLLLLGNTRPSAFDSERIADLLRSRGGNAEELRSLATIIGLSSGRTLPGRPTAQTPLPVSKRLLQLEKALQTDFINEIRRINAAINP